ncbi:MAG: hypothetical protein ACI9S8_001490 [Chlamydiales bacterium]|jgi:hypothetical protein
MLENFDLSEYEKIFPYVSLPTPFGELLLFTPNSVAAWRANTLFTKEPDTIEWINQFEMGSSFIDIGANMGVYSLWAALSVNAQVYAFKPEAENFRLLQKNISINKLSAKITAWPAAVFDESKFSVLYLSCDEAASSYHSFDQSQWTLI